MLWNTDILLPALAGGMLIGLAVVLMMAFNGRITGNSGIIAGLLSVGKSREWWRAFYAAGLILGAGLSAAVFGPVPMEFTAGIPGLIVAGLLVGYGTSLGSGCTAGHGVCGMARLSVRSIAATAVFMASAMLTVWVMGMMEVTP